MDFLKNNSNSFGHLVMSLAFMTFLSAVIIFVHNDQTVTFAVGLMTLLFGYWFGAQSTQIRHQDPQPPTPTSPAPLLDMEGPLADDSPTAKMRAVTVAQPAIKRVPIVRDTTNGNAV